MTTHSDRRCMLNAATSVFFMGLLLDSAAVCAQAAGELQEVTITATKRAESIFDAPLSVSALTKSAMDDQGLRNISDIALNVPGLRTDDRAVGGSGISIRGIFATTGASTTGVYIDDTSVAVRSGIDANMQPIYAGLFDIDRVEVLRGPQGTLYGAGSEGGTVRFITTAPSLEEYSVYSRAELASNKKGDPTYEAGIAGGGPLIDGVLGFRASAWTRQDGGWLDRRANTEFSDGRLLEKNSNSSRVKSGRFALLWKPAERLTVAPSFYYQDSRDNDSDEFFVRDGLYEREGPITTPTRSEAKLSSNSITFDAGPVTVTGVTSYVDALGSATADISINDAKTLVAFGGITQGIRLDDELKLDDDPDNDLPDGAGSLGLQPYDPPALASILAAYPAYIAPYITRSRMRQWSQEIRVASKDEPGTRLSWVAGVYWQDTHSRSDQNEVQSLLFPLADLAIGPEPNVSFWLPGALLPGDISYQQLTHNNDKQTAAFADLTFGLTERLKLTGGLRVARTEFSFTTGQGGPWVGEPHPDGGKQKETPVTPKVGVVYSLDRGVLYATAAKGYRIGGANARLADVTPCAAEVEQRFGAGNNNPLTYDSDTVWSYEIGAKKSGIAERIEVAASVFHVKWSDIQNNVVLDCLFNYTDNTGTATSEGFDLSVSGKVTDGLRLGADIGYVDAHLTQSTFGSGGSTPTSPDDTLLAKKNDSLGGPKWTAHLYADLRRPMADGDAYVRADYNYQEAYAIDPRSPDVIGSNRLVNGDSDPLHLTSLRVGYRRAAWDLSLFADNLFDSKAITSRSDFSGPITARITHPRTVGVTMTYSLQ